MHACMFVCMCALMYVCMFVCMCAQTYTKQLHEDELTLKCYIHLIIEFKCLIYEVETLITYIYVCMNVSMSVHKQVLTITHNRQRKTNHYSNDTRHTPCCLQTLKWNLWVNLVVAACLDN